MSKQKKSNFRQLTAAALALLICSGYAPAVADLPLPDFAIVASAEETEALTVAGLHMASEVPNKYAEIAKSSDDSNIKSEYCGTFDSETNTFSNLTLYYKDDSQGNAFGRPAGTNHYVGVKIAMPDGFEPVEANSSTGYTISLNGGEPVTIDYTNDVTTNDLYTFNGEVYCVRWLGITEKRIADALADSTNPGVLTFSYTIYKTNDDNQDVAVGTATINIDLSNLTIKSKGDGDSVENADADLFVIKNKKVISGNITSVLKPYIADTKTTVADGDSFKVIDNYVTAYKGNKATLNDNEKAISYGDTIDKADYLVTKYGSETVTSEVMEGGYKYYETDNTTAPTTYFDGEGNSTAVTTADKVGKYIWARWEPKTTDEDFESNPILIGPVSAAKIAPAFYTGTGENEKAVTEKVTGTGLYIGQTVPTGTVTPDSELSAMLKVRSATGTDYPVNESGSIFSVKYAYFVDNNGKKVEIKDSTTTFETGKNYYLGATVSLADESGNYVIEEGTETAYLPLKIEEGNAAVAEYEPTLADSTDFVYDGTKEYTLVAKSTSTGASSDGITGTNMYYFSSEDATTPVKSGDKWLQGTKTIEFKTYDNAKTKDAGTYRVWYYTKANEGTTGVNDTALTYLGTVTIKGAPITATTGALTVTDDYKKFTNADVVPEIPEDEETGKQDITGIATLKLSGVKLADETSEEYNSTNSNNTMKIGEVTYAYYHIDAGKPVKVEAGTPFEKGETYKLGATIAAGGNYEAVTDPILSEGFVVSGVTVASADLTGVKAVEGLEYNTEDKSLLTGTEKDVTAGAKVWYSAVKVVNGKAEAPAKRTGDDDKNWSALSGLTAVDAGTYKIFYFVDASAVGSETLVDSKISALKNGEDDLTVTIAPGDIELVTQPSVVVNTTGKEYVEVDASALASGTSLIGNKTAVADAAQKIADDAVVYYCVTDSAAASAPAFDGGSGSSAKWAEDGDAVKAAGTYKVWYYVDTENTNYKEFTPTLVGTKEVQVKAGPAALTDGSLVYASGLSYTSSKIELLEDASVTGAKVPDGCTLKFYTVKREDGQTSAQAVPTNADELKAFKEKFRSRTDDADVTKVTDTGTYDVFYYIEGNGGIYLDSTPAVVGNDGVTVDTAKFTIVASYNGGSFKVGDKVPTAADLKDTTKWSVTKKIGDKEIDIDLGDATVEVTNAANGAKATGTFTANGKYNVKVSYAASEGKWDATDNSDNPTVITVALKNAAAAEIESEPTPVKQTLTYSGGSQKVFTAGSSASDGTHVYVYISDTENDPKHLDKANYHDVDDNSGAYLKQENAGTYYCWYYVKGDDAGKFVDSEITAVTSTKVIEKLSPTYKIAEIVEEGQEASWANGIAMGSVIETAVMDKAEIKAYNGDTELKIADDDTPEVTYTLYSDEKLTTAVTDTKFPLTGEKKAYYLKAQVGASKNLNAGESEVTKVYVLPDALQKVVVTDAEGNKENKAFKFVAGSSDNTFTLKATGYTDAAGTKEAAAGHEYKWTVTSATVTAGDYVAVDEDTGVVTVKKAGKTKLDFIITATDVINGSISGTYNLSVAGDADADKEVPVVTVTAADVYQGAEPELTVKYAGYTVDLGTAVDLDGYDGALVSDVTAYYFSDPECKTPVEDIKAAKAGKYYVKVNVTANTKYQEVYSDAAEFSVKVKAEGITIEGAPESPAVDDIFVLTAAVTPEDAESTTVEWSSSDTTAATVDKNTGLVKLLKAGPVTITATLASDTTVKQDLELTVGAKKFAVTYETNGGILPEGISESENLNKLPEELPTPTYEGFKFAGWFTDAKLTVEAVAGADVTKAVTLYAKWEAAKVTIAFNADGGTGEMAEVTVDSGEYILPECKFTAPEGKKFAGWLVGEETKAVGDKVNITADTTVKAVWEDKAADEFTVKFDSDGGSLVTSVTVKSGEKIAKPADPAKDGFIFKGWQLDGADYDFDTAVTKDITLKAVWEEIKVEKFTVKFNSDNGEKAVEVSVNSGDKVAKPEDPTKTGYIFKGWQHDGKDFDFNTAVTGNITLKAAWDAQKFTVRYVLNGAEVDTEEVAYGTKPAKTVAEASEKTGKKLIGWYTDETFTKTFTGNITEAVTLFAKEVEAETQAVVIGDDGQPKELTTDAAVLEAIKGASDKGVDLVLADNLTVEKKLELPKSSKNAAIAIDGGNKEIDFSKAASIVAKNNQTIELSNVTIAAGTGKAVTITGAAGSIEGEEDSKTGLVVEDVTLKGKKATINSKKSDLRLGDLTDNTEKGITVKGSSKTSANVDGDATVNTLSGFNNLVVQSGSTLVIEKKLSVNNLTVEAGATLVIKSGASVTVKNLTGDGTIEVEAGFKSITFKTSVASDGLTLEGTGISAGKSKIKVPKTMSNEALNTAFDSEFELSNTKGYITFGA